MAKKRKSVATRMDEIDKTMYSTFCSAANSLSQLYSQAMSQQKLSFQAGERHSLEKLYQWILRQNEDGSRVTCADVVAYLQKELDYGEDMSMSPRLQYQHPQPTNNFINSNLQASSGSFGQGTVGQGTQPWQSDQTKNSVFSNALSSPVRSSLQPFHLAQGGYYQNNALTTGNTTAQIQETGLSYQNRDTNFSSSNDASMDMHEGGPVHESY